MHINHKSRIDDPLITPSGEIVYELIGLGEQSGSNQGHSLAQITLPPGKSSPLHYHQVGEESYFILQGTALMEIEGKKISLSAGETCLISAGEKHRISNPSDQDLEFLAVCVPAWHPEDSFLAK